MNEIEKAIESMRRKLKIAKSELYSDPIPCNDAQVLIKNIHIDSVTSFETAIQALREKLKREKGCDRCRTQVWSNDFTKVIQTIYNNHVCINEDGKDVEVNFCPNCGRELKK